MQLKVKAMWPGGGAAVLEVGAASAAEWLRRLVSQVLMVVMDLIIGTAVVLMYLSVFQLAKQGK